jgi:hypothetical protein
MTYFTSVPIFAYFGLVGAFTTAVVTLGASSAASLSPADFAMARSEAILIGVVITSLVNLFLWPVNASQLIRSEVLDALDTCQEVIQQSIRIYGHTRTSADSKYSVTTDSSSISILTDSERNSDSEKLMSALSGYGVRISASILRQSRLVDEASTEPSSLPVNFHRPTYTHLLHNQMHIWRMIFALEPALLTLREHEQVLTGYQNFSFSLPDVEMIMTDLRDELGRLFGTLISALKHGQSIDEEAMLNACDKVERIHPHLSDWCKEYINQVRSGNVPLVTTKTHIALFTFFYSAIELIRGSLLLSQNVRSLIRNDLQTYRI